MKRIPIRSRNVAQSRTVAKGQQRASEFSAPRYFDLLIHPLQIPFAFAMYKEPDMEHAIHFRDTFSRVVDIEFVGVWDTVRNLYAFSK